MSNDKKQEEVLQSLATHIEIITTLSKLIAQNTKVSETMFYVVNAMQKYFKFNHVNFYLLENDVLSIQVGTGVEGQQMIENLRKIELNSEKSIIAHSARNKKSILVKDVSKNNIWLFNPLLPNTKSELAVPIVIRNTVMGVIGAQSNEVNGISKREELFTSSIANQIAIALDYKNTRSELEEHQQSLEKLVEKRTKDLEKEIKERKKIEKGLRGATKIAREALRVRSNLLSQVSHELRTPLHAIAGLTDALLQNLSDEESVSVVKDIKSSSEKLIDTINEILDFASLEAKQAKVTHTIFSIYRLKKDLVTLYTLRNKKEISFKVSIDASVPEYISTDEVKIYQIVKNLIDNAFKFTIKGTITVDIKLKNNKQTPAKSLSELVIIIADTGVGISKKHQEMIFNDFIRIKNDIGPTTGTGLGLAIVKRLVGVLHGTIELKSKLGRGSTFTLTLPFQKAHKPNLSDNPLTSNPNLKDKKILIAEDNRLNSVILQKFLEPTQAIVTLTENGELALSALKKKPYDILLLDLEMPIMDGYEVIREVRETLEIDKDTLPIFVLSAHSKSLIKQHVSEDYINGYILKPFKKSELYSLLT